MAATNVFLCESIAEDKLVEIWGDYPCLYNVRSETFRNRDLREQAMQRIAEEIGQSSDWVKNKIHQLRNSYGKARKTAASGSARKQITKRTAWLTERLQFLAPFVGGRDTVCNLNVSSPDMSQDSFDAGESDGDGNDDDDNSQISQTEVSQLAEEGAMTSTPKSTKLPLKHTQKSQKRKRDDEEFRVIQGLAKSISERNESKKAKISGVCASYGTYVGETLEKLDARTRCIAQHQISNVLFQAQMGTLFQQPQPQVFLMQQTQIFPGSIQQTQSSPSPTGQMFSPPNSQNSPDVFNYQ